MLGPAIRFTEKLLTPCQFKIGETVYCWWEERGNWFNETGREPTSKDRRIGMGKLAGEFDLRCNFWSRIVGRLPAGGTGGNWKWYWKWKGADQWQGGWSVPELPGASLHTAGVVQYVCICTIYTRSNTHRPGEVQYVSWIHIAPRTCTATAKNNQCLKPAVLKQPC